MNLTFAVNVTLNLYNAINGMGSLYVSGKLLTYSSPKPTITLNSHLGQNVGLGEG